MTYPATRTETLLVTPNEFTGRFAPRFPDWLAYPLFSMMGLPELNRAYAKLGQHPSDPSNPFEDALYHLNVRVDVAAGDLERIPRSKPTIVIANHPFGGIDGLALAATMLKHRTDVRILTNSILSWITRLAPWFLDVNVFHPELHRAANAARVREALRHLNRGGMLVVFPAGEVSRFQPSRGRVADDDWSTGVALLSNRSGADVLPCFFEGTNSPVFQAAGLIHPNLKTILLPREMLAKRGTTVRLRIGKVVENPALRRFSDVLTQTAWLRLRCYALEDSPRPVSKPRMVIPVAPAVDPEHIDAELARLPASLLLFEQGSYRVFSCPGNRLSATLLEIARLRELTFRAVDEGTGGARDLDRFDASYEHLVLYDRDTRRIVGAYRLAFVDRVLRESGPRGLYTSSLFRFRPPLFETLNDAIELGRSFVRPEYQRTPLALALLWRGIGEVLARNPRYRRLFGPASISRRCNGLARKVLVAALQMHHSDRKLRWFVEAKRPCHEVLDNSERRLVTSIGRNVKELSRVVTDLSGDGQRMPILLERYLELGATVLALSVDPSFGGCIDALVMVDLDQAPETLVRRFMGSVGFESFRAERLHVWDEHVRNVSGER